MKRLLLLSGPMASGKTSVSAVLQSDFGYVPISSGAFLRAQSSAKDTPTDRHGLQELGDALDLATDFSWLIDYVALPAINARPDVQSWLLDSVRKPKQVERFRICFGDAVRHVHIVAPDAVLQQRYISRTEILIEEYQACVLHPNEQSARSLAAYADSVFDTESYTSLEIARQIMGLWEK